MLIMVNPDPRYSSVKNTRLVLSGAAYFDVRSGHTNSG